eukprot:CAMPEP_0180443420 /NCGR_PEP_ID=MMETSP1036_2-20121128/14663_1 /TAXON_ID=632150 /ORGANISM="Azadinium spinosum, Strain 3D9" /LENGTH=379 /DNA_ID=CAMNT_0022449727 /DNA_START=1 /DNA_END=1136 /DNA_ORIENTATION=+
MHGWVYAWGSNDRCQLGLGASILGSATPRPVDALSRVKVAQVAAGFSHTACVTNDGLLYTWGFGAYGQLGYSFSDIKSSMTLGRDGFGSPPIRTIARNSDEDGSGVVGWVQVWPRRVLRAPFGGHYCTMVRCGAYHTLAQGADEQLEPASASEHEVLVPAPLELSDLPAGTFVADGGDEDLVLPPGAGLVESPKPVLRQGASVLTRKTDTFRTLAGLFWGVSPSKVGSAPTQGTKEAKEGKEVKEVKEVKEATEAETCSEGWRRALASTEPCFRESAPDFRHPLGRPAKDPKDGTSACTASISLPEEGGLMTWSAVDEAVHRAFCNGSVTDRGIGLDLAELTAGIRNIEPPELPGGERSRGLPPAPCRGLARMECLTPR